jgi:hypothetical protein
MRSMTVSACLIPAGLSDDVRLQEGVSFPVEPSLDFGQRPFQDGLQKVTLRLHDSQQGLRERPLLVREMKLTFQTDFV